MQWLIDLIKDWVISQGYLTTSFIDRGDPTAVDFDITDLTRNDAWHDLDLSAIVPKNAKGITLGSTIISAHVGEELTFRKKGNSFPVNISRRWSLVAFELHGADMIIALDEDRVIQYYVTTGGFLVIELTVRNWWF